jgi:hypothetical protein
MRGRLALSRTFCNSRSLSLSLALEKFLSFLLSLSRSLSRSHSLLLLLSLMWRATADSAKPLSTHSFDSCACGEASAGDGRRVNDVRFSRSISSASGTSLKLRGHGKSPVAPLIPQTCRGQNTACLSTHLDHTGYCRRTPGTG